MHEFTSGRSVDEIAEDLRQLGVGEGDLVMAHASLRKLGPVRGGARGVIDAIRAAIDPGGTLVMVLGARDDWSWVNERPEPDRAGLLKDAEPFDALSTPADPEVGTLAEVLRQHPDTLVSDHPEGRFAALGAKAPGLTRDVPWDDYFGPGSPLARMLAWGVKVLRLGADDDSVTLLHHAEYLAPVAHKRRVRRHRRVVTPEGSEIRIVESLDDNEGIAHYDGDDYFAVILRAYLASGRGSRGRVGDADAELLDGTDLVAFGAEWMETNL